MATASCDSPACSRSSRNLLPASKGSGEESGGTFEAGGIFLVSYSSHQSQARRSPKFITHRSLLITSSPPLPHYLSYSGGCSADCPGSYPGDCFAGYPVRNPESYPARNSVSYSAGCGEGNSVSCPERCWESYSPRYSAECSEKSPGGGSESSSPGSPESYPPSSPESNSVSTMSNGSADCGSSQVSVPVRSV